MEVTITCNYPRSELTAENSFLVHEFTETVFRGEFKEHEFDLQREDYDEAVGGTWYIVVTAPDGCVVYDGYYIGNEIADAIAEAIVGSGIISFNASVKITD